MNTFPSRNRSAIMLVIGAAVGVWLATCARPEQATPAAIATASTPATTPPSTPGNLSDVAERVVASVVNISATRTVKTTGQMGLRGQDPFFRDFFAPFQGVPRERHQRSLGSGVIVGDDIVLTNNHVVDHAEDIEVHLADGSKLKAKVVGTDPKSDLAVVRVAGKGTGHKLVPLAFGDSSTLRLGEVVLAVGNPFGVGQTVTMGIVSATGRSSGLVDYEDFIQTDAAINPGNSGGALVNTRGELVGINTAILSRSGGYQGVGFAIPSAMAKPIMESLLNDGKVERGWLGVAIQDLDEDLAKGLGISTQRGVLISDVVPDSPAARAGLERDDVVIALNGAAIDDSRRFRTRIATLGPQAAAELTILRKGKKRNVSAKLGALSESPDAATAAATTTSGPLAALTVATIDDELRRRFDVSPRIKRAVIVTDVARGSVARAAGLAPGDVILELDRRPVTSAKVFMALAKQAGDRVLLRIHRQGRTFYVVIGS